MKKYFMLFLAFQIFPAAPCFSEGLFKDKTVLTPKEIKERNQFASCRIDAQKGNAQAMGVLGLMYEKGMGVPRDYSLAAQWLEKGAQKGDAPAQNNLGFLYLKGKGVKQNNALALQWFQKSAAQGLASAQENLGLVWGGGLGVKKDYEKAFGWFKKAAEQNDPEAQTNLAIMYSLGEGGPKNLIESHKWFSLALAQGAADEELADLRDNIEWLEKRMKGSEIAEAKKRAAAWKPSKGK